MARPRDVELDARILVAAATLLLERGVPALSFEAVAARAGTSRPALYRRYASLTELVVAALGEIATTAGAPRTDDPFTDLVAELEAFRAAITRVRGLNVVGSMLLDSTDGAMKAAYRQAVVQPRRTRIRAILDDVAEQTGSTVSAEARAIATSMCTGSWYAYALAGEEPPSAWPQHTAALVWQALGFADA